MTKLQKVPFWALAYNGQPQWHLGLYRTKQGALAQRGGPGSSMLDAIKVWVAVDHRRRG